MGGLIPYSLIPYAYVYISNISLLLDLEPFQKLGVEEPEIIMRSQRLYGGHKAL